MSETELVDITDQIIAEQEPKFFNEDETIEIYQTCINLMDEFVKTYPKLISEPDFEELFDENISELMHAHFDFDIFYTEEAEEEMEDIIEIAKHDFFCYSIPPRSYPDSIILKDTSPSIDELTKQINILRSKPQPVQ